MMRVKGRFPEQERAPGAARKRKHTVFGGEKKPAQHKSWNCRTREWLGLEGTLKTIQFPPLQAAIGLYPLYMGVKRVQKR